ncbi:YIP1 family protein [Halodesulfovibrio aestuarii]|uniref:YIP1 family protein n=1 Tax=Halodesulfovibrio aestuarii TaxID=126333 RepID=UPI003D3406AE
MEIRCPGCGYARNVNPNSVSADLTVATCPKCGAKFRFRLADEQSPDFILGQDEQGSAQTPDADETSGESRRPVRPEDLYPPSMHGSRLPEQEDSSEDEFWKIDDSQNSSRQEDPLRMVYSDGNSLDGMPNDVPWADVKELGFFPAIVATIKGVLLKPSLFFEIMSKDGKFSIPFSYFILISLVSVLVETVWQSIFGNPLIPAEAAGPLSLNELFSIMFISPLILVIYLFMTGAVLHGVLKLTGAAKGRLGVTLRVLCYASTADLLSIVPVVGPLVGGVWKLVIIVKGLKSAHGTTYTRVLPPVIVLVLVLVLFVVYSLKSQGIM